MRQLLWIMYESLYADERQWLLHIIGFEFSTAQYDAIFVWIIQLMKFSIKITKFLVHLYSFPVVQKHWLTLRSSKLATYQELISFYRLRLQCVRACTSGFVSQIGAGQLYLSIYLRFLFTLPHIPVLLCSIWLVACVGPWECPKHTDFGLWDCKWAFFLFNICRHVSRIPILSSSDRNVETTRSTLTVGGVSDLFSKFSHFLHEAPHYWRFCEAQMRAIRSKGVRFVNTLIILPHKAFTQPSP